MLGRSYARVIGLCGLLASVAGCAEEQYPAQLWEAQHPPAPADASALPIAAGTCLQAAAQPLPQRVITISTQAQSAASANLVYVSTLDSAFEAICGACHGYSADPPGRGSFRIGSANQFPTLMTADILKHVTSNGPSPGYQPLDPNDPLDPMPPFSDNGQPYSKRLATDPVVQFVALVQAWLDAGKPTSFTPTTGDGGSAAAGDGGAVSPYRLTAATADSMTNLGNCIPDRALVDTASEPTDAHTKAAALDGMFASAMRQPPGPGVTAPQMLGLPEHLSDTDMVSFDSAILARHRVVAFQPTYPLWTDDAGKLRYVRVPLGQSIVFNKDTQEFVIPENTRFYKTFMKKIVDTDGSFRWRKFETRLIVARHDTTPDPNAPPIQNALYGTYQWNDDESEATLVETPLRDGLPFSDTLLFYNTDEQLAADLLSQNPPNPDFVLLQAGAGRHYAIPSAQRCVECHMGSPSESFILGFRPVQLNRRAVGQGGTLIEPGQEPPGVDELSQLQRFIDYGVVTSIGSSTDVLPLEQSEGSRVPRNRYELTAQGYMVGNCSHCHNPRGFPSVQFPVLEPVLNFLPGPKGGIFQFPLETYSPRISRGNGGATRIAYITPSLVDESVTPNLFSDGAAYAPWRSLIYRNVDTPFTYTSDYALYPHMPMNMPGYDCRAKQIMSDWMVSIPAVPKNPQLPEYVIGGGDDSPQPYVEVDPGTPSYDDAVRGAQQRLAILHSGINPALPTTGTYSRYAACPDTSDLLDPAVVRDPTCHPVPTPPNESDDLPYVNADGSYSGRNNGGIATNDLKQLAVPGHAHWVNTDLTNVGGAWGPRRADWPNIIVGQVFPPPTTSCTGTVIDSGRTAVPLLQTAKLDDVRAFATKPFPMGLWQQQLACNFSSQPKVSDYATAGAIPGTINGPPDVGTQWMLNNPAVHTATTDPVYAEWPGAAVFNMICINCHGAQADGTGRLADNLATMTGGGSIVADLRDGLFGPLGDPGANLRANFNATVLPAGASAAWTNTASDDMAARYMAWMGLGGTEVTIPTSILQIVGNTQVLGQRRLESPVGASANMLAVAKGLCTSLYPVAADGTQAAAEPWYAPQLTNPQDPANGTYLKGNLALIATNGDAELWLHICTTANPPPVLAVDGLGRYYALDNFFPQAAFQCDAGAPCRIGNDRAGVEDASQGIAVTNLRPWCLMKAWQQLQGAPPVDPSSTDQPPKPLGKGSWPYCPDRINGPPSGGIYNSSFVLANPLSCAVGNACDAWATRGAVNAGFAVFLYLQAIENGTVQRLPDYNQCQLLR